MSNPVYEQVRRNPRFQELTKKRGRLAAILSTIVLVSYYGFMMIVAFAPALLHQPLAEGSVLTVGVPAGAAIIIVGWILTGVYSHVANTTFEEMGNEIVRDIQITRGGQQ